MLFWMVYWGEGGMNSHADVGTRDNVDLWEVAIEIAPMYNPDKFNFIP